MVHLVFKQRSVRFRVRMGALFHFFLPQVSQLPLSSKKCSQNVMLAKIPQYELQATSAAAGATLAFTNTVRDIPRFNQKRVLVGNKTH